MSWQISRLISWLSWAVLDAQGSSSEKLSSEGTNNAMCCVHLDCVLSSQSPSLRLISGYLTLPTLHVSLPGVLSRIPSSVIPSDSHHGGSAGVGATVPPSMKGLKVNVQARGALHWGLSTVTPHGLKFCYSTLFHTASLFHLPHFHRLLFYFTSSILTSLGGTFTAMPPNSPTLSFNLSGLFVEEGRDSNRGETRSKGIKQGGGRRVRKGIQREAANAKSHLRGHIEIYHCGSFLQYTHTWTISKWNHQITGRHLSTSSESSSARNGLHPIELLAKRVP